MKRASLKVMALAAVGVLSVAGGSAWASNPTSWTTSLVTVDTSTSDASWTSLTPIDLGYPSYNYSYEITQANIQLLGITWTDVLGELGSDASGTGAFSAPPVSLQSTTFNETELGTTVTGTLSMYIDNNGYAHLDLSDFNFSGGTVTGLQAQADVTITGVPEPASMALMGLAGGMLLLRRRATRPC
jgi:hypothetical protein